jgi:predicted RNase H-related nuclease YkuK (DUF458 family)
MKDRHFKRNDNRSYAPFSEWIWRSFDGKKKVNIDEFIDAHREDFFLIGTDSQNYSKNSVCKFTSVLIAYHMGRGGSIIMNTDKVPFMDKSRLRQRLLLEAMRSLEVAWYLDSRINDKSIIQVHLDVNPNLKWRSSQYKEELVGLVCSQGFPCIIKPDSFAASKVADKRC